MEKSDNITASTSAVSAVDSVDSRRKVLVLFGTRPEAIKLAPVIHELRAKNFRTVVVSSSQHKDLLKPFLKLLEIEIDYDLKVMSKNQTPTEVCSRVLSKLDKILNDEKPDLILVQGDTTTTLAGALAGFNRRIKVGHVEAGLRSGNLYSPFPEEMNRRLTSQMATFSFCRDREKQAQSGGGKRLDRKDFYHRKHGRRFAAIYSQKPRAERSPSSS